LFAVATFLWSGSQKAPQQPAGNKNKKTEEQFYVDMGPHKKPLWASRLSPAIPAKLFVPFGNPG